MKQDEYKIATRRLRKKVFKGEELSDIDNLFADILIESFVSEKIQSNTALMKVRRTWDVIVYDSLVKFEEFYKNNKNEDKNVLLKEIFILQSKLDKEGDFSYLKDEVSKYYRDVFMTNDSEEKIFFNSKKIEIIFSFVNNTIFLRKGNVLYTRDIDIKELDVFPSRTLKHQCIG